MIGIIGAMEEEVQALRHAMKIQEEKEIASMVFHRGILYGKEAVVVRSGIGKVNAAICTQILADHFDVDLVINTGIAGSLDAAIDIGDMVISTDAVQHDMDTSIFGDPIGQVPRMDTFAFPADAQLVEKAVRANQSGYPYIYRTDRQWRPVYFLTGSKRTNRNTFRSKMCGDGRCSDCTWGISESDSMRDRACNFR